MNRNTRLLTVLAVALVAATLASFVVYRALASASATARVTPTVPTLVAAENIAAGTLIARGHLKVIQWPADSPIAGSLTDPARAIDRGAIVAIAANEPITDAKLAAVGAGAGLPPTIPPGMRAICVRVNEVIGVAGFVVPGTRVDVIVTFEGRAQQRESVARVVVSNAQVLTAGTRFDQEKARQDGRPIPTSVVTLLVTPEDAERVALAGAEGRITLTLRNPLDNAPTESLGHPGRRADGRGAAASRARGTRAAPVAEAGRAGGGRSRRPGPAATSPVHGRSDSRRQADDRAGPE